MFQVTKDAYFAPPVARFFIKTYLQFKFFHLVFLACGIQRSKEFIASDVTGGVKQSRANFSLLNPTLLLFTVFVYMQAVPPLICFRDHSPHCL